MTQPSPLIQKFFAHYETDGDVLDLERISSEYAETFMFGTPDGTRIIEKEKFLAVLPKRQELFKSLGHKSTMVLSLDETRLDEHYAIVRAYFLMRFEPAGKPPIDAKTDSTFIFYIKDNAPKIIAHIEHEDLIKAMQARGVMPKS